MKFVIQRVTEAAVHVDGQCVGNIGKGFLVLIGVCDTDTEAVADKMIRKMNGLRIFEDENGKMNRSITDEGLEFLVVSQFTLCGDCKKGTRPSFDGAAAPDKAVPLYEYFVECLRSSGLKVETGKFQAMMDVELVNDGPVTFMLDK